MRKWIPLILVIAVVFSSGCVVERAWPPQDISDCSALEDDPELYDGLYTPDECYMTLALGTDNANVCDELDITGDNQICIAKIAGRTGQHGLCFSLQDTHYRHNCFYSCWDDCKASETLLMDGEETAIGFGRMPGEIPESDCRSALENSTDPLFDPCVEIISKTDMDPAICDLREGDTAAVCRYYYALYYVDSEACASLGNETYRFESSIESTSGSIVMGETHYLGSFSKETCMDVIGHFRA